MLRYSMAKRKHHPSLQAKNQVAASVLLSLCSLNLLQGIDELAVVHRGRVDDLLDELPVTVGISRGHVEEDLQVLHPVGQRHHLLGGQDVQLHGISERRGQ